MGPHLLVNFAFFADRPVPARRVSLTSLVVQLRRTVRDVFGLERGTFLLLVAWIIGVQVGEEAF
jgi:hypothetical protein